MRPTTLPRTINATQMKHVNRSAILELIRQHSPMARSEISRLLKISLPTVIRIVDELIADGLVCSTGETAGDTGRPCELLEYNKNGSAVIGIDLGGTNTKSGIVSREGELLHTAVTQTPAGGGRQVLLHHLKAVARLVLIELKRGHGG